MEPTQERILLSPDRVEDLALFREPGFDLLLDYLVSERFEIDPSYTLVNKIYAKIDGFYWRADRPLLRADGKRDGTVTGHNVIHHAIHHSVHRKFPRLEGRPRMAFFGEALASAADVYYTLVYFSAHGDDHPFARSWIRDFKHFSDRLGVPFMDLFREAVKDPFETYRTCVEDMYAFSDCLFDLALHANGRPYHFDRRLASLTSTFRYFGLISCFDFANFVHYAIRHCGTESDPTDRRDVEECRALLRSATSMEDFLLKVGIERSREERQWGAA